MPVRTTKQPPAPNQVRYKIYISYDESFFIEYQDADDEETFPQDTLFSVIEKIKVFITNERSKKTFPDWIESRVKHFGFIRYLISKQVFSDY